GIHRRRPLCYAYAAGLGWPAATGCPYGTRRAWKVPSRAVIAVRPKLAVRVYEAGEKVEVGRDREVYGYSWFPATVAKAIDDLSYVVEYSDLEGEVGGAAEKATEYLHWQFIRPAMEHSLQESEVRLGPGAAVEAYCDGAWSAGVVRRAVGDDEFEVSINGNKARMLVTKAVEFLKPHYKWEDGRHWRIVSAKRQVDFRKSSASGKRSRTNKVTSSDDEHSQDPDYSGAENSRKELQQNVVILAEVASKKKECFEEPLGLQSSLESPSTGQKIILENTESTQQLLDRTMEDTVNANEVIYQEHVAMVPLSFESAYNGIGMHGSKLHKGLTDPSSGSQENRHADALRHNTGTQVPFVKRNNSLIYEIDEAMVDLQQKLDHLRQKLDHLRQKAQLIEKEKEDDEEKLSRLNVVESSVKEALGAHKRQFDSILAGIGKVLLQFGLVHDAIGLGLSSSITIHLREGTIFLEGNIHLTRLMALKRTEIRGDDLPALRRQGQSTQDPEACGKGALIVIDALLDTLKRGGALPLTHYAHAQQNPNPPMAAAGRRRSPARNRLRRRDGLDLRRSPRLPRSPMPPAPLRPGDEVEVRLDADGYFGTWYEATVVGFAPARGRGSGARYAVAYSPMVANDGGRLPKSFAATHIRRRPPPPSSGPSPQRFRTHDIVEALDRGGWWAGIVVAAAGPTRGGGSVTVAFPITREVIAFAPHFVRPRCDYVGGEWVPSRAVLAEQAQPKRVLRAYDVGDKVEVWKNREVYGYSWFAATVTKVFDRFSYIVEYSEQEEGEKATEYLYWKYIRPAMDCSPRESEFQLVPGAAVEAYCDGAWSPGVVHRVVGEDEYEVSVNRGEANRMVAKVVELLKPHYRWNGNRWRIDKPKRRANLRKHSASRKCPSSPEYSCTKKARKELQRQEVILAGASEHVPVSETDNPLSASHESPASNHCANSCHPLPDNKGGKMHLIQALQRKKDASDNVHSQLKENNNSCSKEIDSALSASLDCQTSSAFTRQVSTGINSDLMMNVYARKLKNLPMVKMCIICITIVECALQYNNCLMAGFLWAGVDTHSNLLDKGLTSTTNSICLVIRNKDVHTDNTSTQEATDNHIMETPTLYPDQLVQQNGGNMNEKSIPLGLQNAGSLECITENNISRSSSIGGSSMPSHLAVSQISGHQVVFVKTSPVWALIEAMDVFKKVPQQPHFRPLQGLPPGLREGMALGLMATFAKSVENIRKLSLADSMASFEEESSTLHHLKENGFNVQSLQNVLNTLVQIKIDNTRHLEEKGNLKAKILEKTTSLSEFDLLLDENGKAIAELEKNLCNRRYEGQKIAKEKEHKDAELSRLKAADSNVEEACGDDEQKFRSVVVELQRKHLT
ncbi:hypothetical protein BAE44_0011224, partial [Dichanthelium oligosanthes]